MIEKCKSLAAALVAQGDKHYAEFEASPGWIRDVMARSGYGRVKLHGLFSGQFCKGDSDLFPCAGSGGDIIPEEADKRMLDFCKQIEDSGVVNPKALFNADETGLFYK